MHVTIQIDGGGDASQELRSLRDWLRDDPEVKGPADLVVAQPAAGDMGALSDTLNVVLGPGEVAAVATAIGVWLRTRKSNVKLSIKDGERAIEIDATNVDDPERLLPLLLRREP